MYIIFKDLSMSRSPRLCRTIIPHSRSAFLLQMSPDFDVVRESDIMEVLFNSGCILCDQSIIRFFC